MGVSMASLRQSGMMPVDSDLLMMVTRVGSKWVKTCLKSWAGRGSRLLDLMGEFFMIFSNSEQVMGSKDSNRASGGFSAASVITGR